MRKSPFALLTSTIFLGLAALSQAADLQLWDNGGFITQNDGGFNNGPISNLQNGNNFGVGLKSSTNNQGADDFQVPANTKYRINNFVFFGYQSGSGTTSSITSAFVKIWDGPPGSGGNIIYTSPGTVLSTSSFTGVYRVAPNALTSTTRPIMQSTCTLPGGVLLDGTSTGKTFWISYSAAGSLSSGPWAVLVTLPNQDGKPGANARQQLSDMSWIPVKDDGAAPGFPSPIPQDLTFKLSGKKTELLAPASFSVTNGTLFSGNLASLTASDNNRLSLFNDPDSLEGTVVISSTASNNAGSTDMQVTVEHSAARTGLAVSLALLNSSTSDFDEFYSDEETTSDATNILNATNPAYISGSGIMKVRADWFPFNDEAPTQDGWLQKIDYVSFQIEP